MAKKTYTVASPIKHDGKDYSIGDSIDLEDKEAGSLLDVKAIKVAATATEVSSASKTPAAPGKRKQ